MIAPPLKDRPVDFALPTSVTGQLAVSSRDILCGCRCGYLVSPTSSYQCLDPNHEGSRILLTSNCFVRESENSSSGTCNFCLVRLGHTLTHNSTLSGARIETESMRSENDDVVGPFEEEPNENDDSNIQNKSIQDLSELFFKEDQTAVEYLTMCEESYERQKELLA
jgi:hypothetical protein